MYQRLCIAVFCLVTNGISAQMKEATFDKGITVKYEILDRTTEHIRPWMIMINAADPGLEFQYYRRKTFMAEAGATLNKLGADFTYYIIHTHQEKKESLIVKSAQSGANTITHFMTKDNPVDVDHNWGIHYGIAYLYQGIINVYNDYSATQLALGIGHFRTVHMAYKLEADEHNPAKWFRSFTRRTGFYADVLYFPHIAMATKDLYIYNGTLPPVKNLGWQFYIQGTSVLTAAGRNEFGVFWRAGWAMGISSIGWPIWGLGLAF
ncbi:MAG TPA: hypothetical protein VNZ86_12860 [Bacteroidia bacterium]|jgi:hypothetical protein|nr:hypothetical protein [Bacteroidia bacterium]